MIQQVLRREPTTHQPSAYKTNKSGCTVSYQRNLDCDYDDADLIRESERISVEYITGSNLFARSRPS